ncbi:MAG: alanine dehydrogenase [Firmicutes bacterium]|nr:alanine dehydrogenase [Bacillota bacterium]
MIVGVPKEIKDQENRVGMTPAGVEELVRRHGHRVLVERGAGEGSGIPDEEYAACGAEIVESAEEVYARAELIVKVKEPLPSEYPFLREGQVLMTFLHLAPEPELTRTLLQRGVIGIAYETIQRPGGSLPCLMPMSEVAGRMAVQVGAKFLEKAMGGRGVLLGGVPGVPPAEVVIVGAGTVGASAAKIALGMGAHVTLIDINGDRLRYLAEVLHGNLITVMSNRYNIERAVRYADLLIGAVLVPGAKAPILVTDEMVQQMKPGSVIIDVAVDQGGCIETVDRATTHSHPTYVKHGVVHYAVPNMPGAVPRTSTLALTNATLPYVVEVANLGPAEAARRNPALAHGVNVWRGHVVHRAVAEAHSLPYTPLDEVL